MLGKPVTGIDLDQNSQAPIDYHSFDGTHFPVADNAFDGVLFCYVLHHAQDLPALFAEVRRVLRPGASIVVYEDIPKLWWDRLMCLLHNLQWKSRTGPCTFRTPKEWRNTFASAGLEIASERTLRRMRNLAHPVCRKLYVVRIGQ
jgi:ubiquinone/menaquinone biosynthesis C-methylase UbiE